MPSHIPGPTSYLMGHCHEGFCDMGLGGIGTDNRDHAVAWKQPFVPVVCTILAISVSIID